MSKPKKILLIVVAVVAVLAAGAIIFRDELTRWALNPTESTLPEGVGSANGEDVQVLATGLDAPWGIVFLPDDDMLVTERPGTVKRIADNNQTYTIDGVVETSEGGLLGIALHPDYGDNNFVYLYSTYREGEELANRVLRYTYVNNRLSLDRTIIDGIPGSSNHDGGALAFGPDGKLYITTGDANIQSAPQDTDSLAGKILRLNDDGSIPDDNPFDNPVYSYGHRNPQGIAWDDQERMWATEHGPSGSASGRDELNLIEAGANYGWPEITGDETREGMRSPVAQSGDNETWAPGALVYHDGSLYFTGLRGQTLYQAEVQDGDNISVTLKRHFSEEYGRLRAAQVHNGNLYISTSNRDGRGSPNQDDDKIIRIRPRIFE